MVVTVTRQEDDGKQTLGTLSYTPVEGAAPVTFPSLELPWKNNERGKSCIPVGNYKAIKHTSPKHGHCFWLQDVPGRAEVLIHSANYVTELRGCIAIGSGIGDINKDGQEDLLSSKKAIAAFLADMPKEITVKVEYAVGANPEASNIIA